MNQFLISFDNSLTILQTTGDTLFAWKILIEADAVVQLNAYFITHGRGSEETRSGLLSTPLSRLRVSSSRKGAGCAESSLSLVGFRDGNSTATLIDLGTASLFSPSCLTPANAKIRIDSNCRGGVSAGSGEKKLG